MKILVYGLPESGKTYMAQKLKDAFGDDAEWFNADVIRTECDDWDFSKAGRERQNQRMRILSTQAVERGKIAICDFICPLEETREAFDADFEVFVDTVNACQFDDTNKMFERPKYDEPNCIIPHYRVKHKRGDLDARIVAAIIKIIKNTENSPSI